MLQLGIGTSMPLPPSVEMLTSIQNADGGWCYAAGSSWTEPTALALLAMMSRPHRSDAFDRGIRWLTALRRADGGWPPSPNVAESTWVTALAATVLAESGQLQSSDSSIDWLLNQTGRESSVVHRLRRWMLGIQSEYGEQQDGWPWFPGAAAWVSPTASTIVALQKVQKRHPRPEILARIHEGQEFLLARTCRDGGWNHGSSRALGYESDSYPETTGLALVALRGVQSPRIARALVCAEKHLNTCRSSVALSWLHLGLLAHGTVPPSLFVAAGSSRDEHLNAIGLSLRIIAHAAENGRNAFLS